MNTGLELQINSLQAENRYRGGSNRKSLRIFEDEEGGPENLEHMLLQAKERIRNLENEREGAFDKQTNLREFATRVHQLENENEVLKQELMSKYSILF